MQDDHIYRVIELAGTSDKSIEDAVSSAIARANKTIRNLRWFELMQTRGLLKTARSRIFR
jgi:flavin-binding protein dodecin